MISFAPSVPFRHSPGQSGSGPYGRSASHPLIAHGASDVLGRAHSSAADLAAKVPAVEPARIALVTVDGQAPGRH